MTYPHIERWTYLAIEKTVIISSSCRVLVESVVATKGLLEKESGKEICKG